MTYIYKIVDNTNGNIYVGSSNDKSKRKSRHKILKDCSSKIIIDNNDWDFIIIEECDEGMRYDREQYYMDTLDNVINERKARILDYTNYKKDHYDKNKDKYKEYSVKYRKKHNEKTKDRIHRLGCDGQTYGGPSCEGGISPSGL